MIREARFQDIEAIEAMLREMYAASKYLGRVNISDKAMRDLLTSAVATQNQFGPQASLVRVSEQAGKPVGFVVGSLSRVYHIGDKLEANDIYLYVRKGARVSHTFALIDAYIAWASANRRVLDINLSWTDTLPGASRIAAIYLRKGFSLVGEMYQMRLDETAMKEAA